MIWHPTCHAVERYLAAMFPQSIIEEYEWKARECWVFKVSVPRLTFQLLVSTDFLDKTRDSEIERLLTEWHAATHMRRLGREFIFVTASGVTQGVPQPA